MVSSSQIRHRMFEYLRGHIDLATFEDWFVQSTWNIHLAGSRAAEVLTFAIEESLSEFSSEHLSEDELRSELTEILYAETQIVPFSNESSPKIQVVSSPPLIVPVVEF
jgi:hypothetical protein